jgi:ABC-type multidrug transport system ATPase subunit
MATLLERNHAAALLDQSSAAAVRVENLWTKYGALEAVRGVSLNVKQGEVFGLIGPDGAG